MKFLILSSDTSGDRDSVASAVSEAAENAGIECVIADPSALTEETAGSYKKLIRRIPGAKYVIRGAGKLYSKTGLSTRFQGSSFIKSLNSIISSGGFDAVISADKTVTETITGHEIAAPFYAVLTDYTCPNIKKNAPFDTYFIPHESMRDELIARNIPPEKISVFGVPVPMRFKKQLGKRAARNYLVIPQNRKVYLLLASGMSAGSAEEICDGLIKTETGDFSVYCLVGRESETKDALLQKYRNNSKIQVITFTEKINIYMEAADVVLSQPFGITSAEAAVSAVPLVHITPLTGWDKTADFFSSHEMSLKGFDVRDIVKKANRLLENRAAADRMRVIQKSNCPSDGAEKIVRSIIELTRKKHKITT